MGWFSPVKGSYPSLAQVDKTLPVDASAKTIKRGTIVALSTDSTGVSKEGVWKIATGADTEILYVAIQDYSDPTAGFAGSAFVPNPTGTHPARPAITALDLAQDAEYETDVFDTTQDYVVGQKLYVGDGGKLSGTQNGQVVGYVTLPATSRWINNAIAVPDGETDQRLAYRTGATRTVLRFKTK